MLDCWRRVERCFSFCEIFSDSRFGLGETDAKVSLVALFAELGEEGFLFRGEFSAVFLEFDPESVFPTPSSVLFLLKSGNS